MAANAESGIEVAVDVVKMMRGPDLHCAVDRVQLQLLSEVESRQWFDGGNSHEHGYNHAPVRLKIFRQYFRSLRRVQPTQHAHAKSSGTRVGRVALEERAGGPGGGGTSRRLVWVGRGVKNTRREHAFVLGRVAHLRGSWGPALLKRGCCG